MIVYWIREEHHTDPYVEGYIGITSKDLEERVREHRKNKRRSIVAEKLRNKPLVYSVLHKDLSLEDALDLEALYRPEACIGWNLQKGGELGVEPSWYSVESNRHYHSMKTSSATRRGIATKDTTEARSKRAKENWKTNRSSYEGVSVGDRNPRAILTEADVHIIKYLLLPEGLGNTEIAKLFGVRPYLISFIRTGKNWSHV